MRKGRDLEQEVCELNSKIAELEQIIASLTEPMEQMREFAGKYLIMIDTFLRLGTMPQEALFAGVKDDISREIMRALLRRPESNISELTEIVREQRGSASRRIIRERLINLEEAKKVERVPMGRRTVYRLPSYVVTKWSQMLGFLK